MTRLAFAVEGFFLLSVGRVLRPNISREESNISDPFLRFHLAKQAMRSIKTYLVHSPLYFNNTIIHPLVIKILTSIERKISLPIMLYRLFGA
ncbi:MAG: hypothetical protein ACXAEX_24170 [Promethearchaeota archaeon]